MGYKAESLHRMDKPIIISFRWSFEELLLAHKSHMRFSKLGRKFRRIIFGGGMFFLALGIVFAAQRNLAPAFPLFALAFGFLASPLFLRRALRKSYAQKPDRDLVVTYEISAERLAVKSEVASSEMLWRTILRVHRVPQGFLLYPTDHMFHWLPITGFRDAADVERLAQLAKSNVQDYSQKT